MMTKVVVCCMVDWAGKGINDAFDYEPAANAIVIKITCHDYFDWSWESTSKKTIAKDVVKMAA